jgi:hypothetical protein
MRAAAVIGAVASTLALSVTAANATPSRGVTGTVISKTTFAGKDYIVREVTLQPGGSTGWHYHRGTLGGFNRSSQHLDSGGVDGQASGVDESVDRQVGDEVAGGSVASAGCGAVVLA